MTIPDVKMQVIACQDCVLAANNTAPVPYRGPDDPDIVIIGEDLTNPVVRLPISGAPLELLNEALSDAGLDDDTVTMMNTVACHGAGDLKWDHVEACTPNRVAQLDHLDPRFVLLLGNAPLKAWRRHLTVKNSGRIFVDDGRVFFYTYHPATVLRIAMSTIEDTFRHEIERFAELTAGDPDDIDHLNRFVHDTCACCHEWACWWHTDLVAYCQAHLPPDVRPMFDARMALCHPPRTASDVWRAANHLNPDDVTANTIGVTHLHARATETAAAQLVQPRTGTHRDTALKAIAAAPDGLTDEELAATTGIHQPSIAPRRVELAKQGWVHDSGRTRPTRQGAEATVWVLTPPARSKLS